MRTLRYALFSALLAGTLAGCVYEPGPGYGYSSPGYYYQPAPSYSFGFGYYGGGGDNDWHHRRHWGD